MDLKLLRAATEVEHRAVEGIMPIMSADLSLTMYQEVLSALYGVLRAWDDWAKQHGPEWLQDEIVARRRSQLLEADLQHFDQPLPSNLAVLNLPAGEAAFLGAMYVIEGSTLGGQYIAHHVEKTLHLRPREGDAYFVGYGEQTSVRWRAFQDILRRVPEHHSSEVILGARAMFSQFRLWMSQELGISA